MLLSFESGKALDCSCLNTQSRCQGITENLKRIAQASLGGLRKNGGLCVLSWSTHLTVWMTSITLMRFNMHKSGCHPLKWPITYIKIASSKILGNSRPYAKPCIVDISKIAVRNSPSRCNKIKELFMRGFMHDKKDDGIMIWSSGDFWHWKMIAVKVTFNALSSKTCC